MSTKVSIRRQSGTENLPDWNLYTETFELDDVVYLELRGVQADVTMIDTGRAPEGATVLLRLPTKTAKQLGLVPEKWQNE
ncbi:hypothetical protein [Burkholderia multivorans]|uniref:hypothetical protein n=1 Tax=Burkholderia multivorans TaxID=87883 RepID=UPI000CFFC288|nr:hypothetical protein [Burkholderia multivorans]MBU9490765.1 hypothetical protein [Burkholderia multivorans]MDR8919456.1 hypothetical protein [Burkholderia multivorans]MDR8925962.1 hypothetical protein [Burkholderia multivorans]MDR8967199.1 hypothetical protein [Burkholderia multivorans]MDR8993026.1 hypothetical protein [Burkholderia multivorans]